MYNASEHTFNKNKTIKCMSRAADDHKVKKFTEFLPCTFAMYDCRQLEDVSSIENVHMVTDLLLQVFIR